MHIIRKRNRNEVKNSNINKNEKSNVNATAIESIRSNSCASTSALISNQDENLGIRVEADNLKDVPSKHVFMMLLNYLICILMLQMHLLLLDLDANAKTKETESLSSNMPIWRKRKISKSKSRLGRRRRPGETNKSSYTSSSSLLALISTQP